MNTLEAAVHLLRRHNRWRRGDESASMVDPALLGCAIDVVCDHIDPPREVDDQRCPHCNDMHDEKTPCKEYPA